jgi:hypothetical protein
VRVVQDEGRPADLRSACFEGDFAVGIR